MTRDFALRRWASSYRRTRLACNSSRAGTAVLITALLVVLGAFKLAHNPGLTHKAPDGNYYLQIARNVARGDGFRTDVALYYQGFKDLPAPATVYPLWPLALGGVARIVGLQRASQWLPEVFYVIACGLAYFVANQLARAWAAPQKYWPLRIGVVQIDLGIVALILLGLNRVFFWSTSRPYTEGLAFALIFACLLSLARLAETPSRLWGGVTGALGGLAYLARSQSLLMVFGIMTALTFICMFDRRYWKVTLATAGGLLVVVLPWLVYLRHLTPPAPWTTLINFAAYRENAAMLVGASPSVIDSVLARTAKYFWQGMRIAFDPTNRNSYYASFGPAIYLVPLVALRGLFLPARARDFLRALASARGVLVLATVLGALASISVIHITKSPYTGWLFRWRHGLPYFFLLLLAFQHLVSRGGRTWRAIAVALLLGSMWTSSRALAQMLPKEPSGKPNAPAQKLMRWIKREDPIIASASASWVSVHSGARAHWLNCKDGADQIRRLFRYVPIQHLVVLPHERRCRYYRGLSRELELAEQFGQGQKRVEVFRVSP